MSFVNRKIQEEDRALYALDEAEASKPRGVLLPERSWTVDDGRRMYLRDMGSTARGPEPEQDPKSVRYRFHFHVNDTTYLLSLTKDLTRCTSITFNQNWTLKHQWILTGIDPRDYFTESPTFLSLLKEAMTASFGGDAHMAMRLADNNWTIDYTLNLEMGTEF